DMPPLVMTEGEGGFDGLDADIIKGFAEAECLVIEPVNVGATAAVTSVEQGRVDTSLGGWSRTEERDQILSLSGPMYLDGIIVVGDQEYSTFDELDGLNIGVVQGYVVQGELEAAFPGQVQSYPEATLLSEDLKTGRIDVAVDVSSSVAYYDEGLVVNVLEPDERLQTTVNPIQTALPFNKENPDLADAFSAYLEVIHESGEIVELLEKWGIDPSMADVGEPRFV
ncbi:substrate-binding periplasmic protein, partial [Agrococcus casei]|uniref:substrate-binding periplasmic protein n=1 Tax=Agrococcus casei TaxID=343512 RepID=UPI003F8DA7A4